MKKKKGGRSPSDRRAAAPQGARARQAERGLGRSEARSVLLLEVLELLNEARDARTLIRDILALLKDRTGFEAVGVRMKEGDDYPYFASMGFPAHFIEAENYLCARDYAGELVRDPAGVPRLECICGDVISGRSDSRLPYFTGKGSFWTNSTSALLGSGAGGRGGYRESRCSSEGYESVALIPLRSGEEIVGLLQLNDTRRGCFNPEMIRFFEEMGNSFGVALRRCEAERRLQEKSDFLRKVLESFPHPFYVVDVSDYRVIMANSAARQGGGEGKTKCYELACARSKPCGSEKRHLCPIEKVRRKKAPEVVEHLHKSAGGSPRTVEVHCFPVFDERGDVVQVIEYVIDVTERKKAERAEMLKRFSERLIDFQEEERKRIARELHDGIGGDLTAISLSLAMMERERREASAPLSRSLKEARKLVASALDSVRGIASHLRPAALDELGLVPCLRQEAETLSRSSGVKIRFSARGFAKRVSPHKELAIYRVVQEALTNIVRHAAAKEATVKISRNRQRISLTVEDDGRGFDPSLPHGSDRLGLLGMRERVVSEGGTFRLESSPGNGTSLEIAIPVQGSGRHTA